MRKLSVVVLLALFSLMTFAQTAKAPVKSAAPTPARPKAIIQTNAGNITCTLFPDKAPLAVENFIGLAEGTKTWINPVSHAKKEHTPLYDGTIFHRVIPEFMIQGGDPAGNGSGDPGYKFKDEITDLKFDRPGRLAMANSGPDTNGSQFFITELAYPSLNGHYSIFGQCDDIALVQHIARMPRDANDKPLSPIRIRHIQIVRPGTATPKTAPAKKPVQKKPSH
jgi:cyclophilin family peptidyl-prolyl cis-trans isomerase